jgi:hypothetical protein
MKREPLNQQLNLLPIWLDSWLSLSTYNGLEQSRPRSSSMQRSAFSLAAERLLVTDMGRCHAFVVVRVREDVATAAA